MKPATYEPPLAVGRGRVREVVALRAELPRPLIELVASTEPQCVFATRQSATSWSSRSCCQVFQKSACREYQGPLESSNASVPSGADGFITP